MGLTSPRERADAGGRPRGETSLRAALDARLEEALESSTTANLTALVRSVHPAWRSASVPTRGARGEEFGRDAYAELALTDVQREVLSDPETREAVRGRVQASMPGICAYVWGRSRCIDSELHRAIDGGLPPAAQLAILGAGYDTSCYRFAEALDAAGVRRFEVDLPALQRQKRTALEALAAREPPALRAALERVTFVPLDLSRPKKELLAGMRAAGYETERVTVFVWEGVTAYLTAEAVRESLEFMAAGCAPGSTLLVTFISEAPAPGNVRHKLHRDEEPQSYFPAPERFARTLDAAGWAVERAFAPEELAVRFDTLNDAAPVRE